MDQDQIRSLVARQSTVPEKQFPMVVAMVERAELSGIPGHEVSEKIAGISFEQKPSTPYDDDTYWAAESPFDGQWYLFATGIGGDMPTEPVQVVPHRPHVMCEV